MAETLPIKKTKTIFDEIEKMQDRVMQRAYDIFRTNGGSIGRDLADWLQAERELVWKPDIELEEKDNEFRLKIAVPGVDPKNIDIEVTPEDVLVKGELHHQHKEKKGEIHTCEFASGNLFRSIHLPKRIDTDKVKAEFKNGMLTLKAVIAEEARARKVAVDAS
jgi:HSP20 family protein